METIKIEGREFTGTFEQHYNGSGFTFRLENGETLRANFKQGYTGKKLYRFECTFNSKKQFIYRFNNSGRQVKDPNAYFVSF